MHLHRPGDRRTAPAVLLVLVSVLSLSRPGTAQVPDPGTFFGDPPGTEGVLFTWEELDDYYRTVAASSPRVRYERVGEATEGTPFVMLLISSRENLERAEEYRQMIQRLADPRTWDGPEERQRLIDSSRAVVMHNAAIHSTEVGTHQAPPLLVHELAVSDDPAVRRILEEVILVMIPSHNPDGTVKVTDWWREHRGKPWQTRLPFLYQKYVGHDNNRDWYTFFQKESQLTLEVHNAWHPQVVLDQHQMGSGGARIFVPPFEDPIEPNVDPWLVSLLSTAGPFIGSYLAARDMPGAEWGRRYDAWTPARAYHHYKGGIRILTEVASTDWALSIEVPEERLGSAHTDIHWNHPYPWEGGRWTFEEVVDYNYTSAKALLLFAANNRRQILEGFASVGERSMAREGDPAGFVIPAGQANAFEVGELLEVLRRAEVEILTARSPLQADGRQFPPGSRVIPITQPYGRFAKAVLERQDYPDLRLYEGGPPDLPYDVTAHTLPLLMGVEAVPVTSWTGGRLTPASSLRPAGGIAPGAGEWYAMDPANTGSLAAASRLRARGIDVFRTPSSIPDGSRTWPAGTLLVPAGEDTRRAVEEIVGPLGVEAGVLSSRLLPSREGLLPVGRCRIGLVQSWFASIPTGWTEWVLQHYGWDYRILRPRELADPEALSEVDAVLLAGETERAVVEGWAPSQMPPDYVGGAGEEGMENLRDFVHRGGVLLAWGGSEEWAAPLFDIRLSDGLEGLEPREFFIPGSILRGSFRPGLQVNAGLGPFDALWFRHGSALLVDETDGVVLARYASRDVLLSGWALGTDHLRDHAAAAGYRRGEGAVILFGFDPQYRGQTRQTMKMLWNAVLGAGGPGSGSRLLERAR
ncbi:MAG: M14 family zinc carboxypeptidase [bacterium]